MMNLEEKLSSGSKQEAINMAIEIIEIELYSQFLALGISPESFGKEDNVTTDDLPTPVENPSAAEWVAYNSIPRLINRRASLIAKLQEMNNA
jgi:hypothetical protein